MRDEPDLFDLPTSRAARDEGMSLVLDHDEPFAIKFARTVINLPRGWVGQCEDIRKVWPYDLPKPQAWGAAWNAAKRAGWLVELPQRAPMTGIKSHARKTNLYRRA